MSAPFKPGVVIYSDDSPSPHRYFHAPTIAERDRIALALLKELFAVMPPATPAQARLAEYGCPAAGAWDVLRHAGRGTYAAFVEYDEVPS